MKQNKHIHDEDHDFSIKLIVPLLSILVCAICLCATTWAWYTASVSTGVNSIKAGVGVQVSATINGQRTTLQDGSYTLDSNDVLQLSFSGSGAANGYYALLDINDVTSTGFLPNALIDLFATRIYADNSIKKAVYFSDEAHIEIHNNSSVPKTIEVNIVWASSVKDEEGKNKLDTDMYPYYETITNPEKIINTAQTTSITINYLDIEENPLPASVLGIETYDLRDNLEEEPAIISLETVESEITVTAPEGYLLQKDSSFNEDTDVPSRTYQIEPVEEIEIDVICVKIEEEPPVPDTSEEENQEVDEIVEDIEETEPTEISYSYTVNCIDTDSYTLINSFTGESLPGEITIDIPLIDGYVADSNTTVIRVTENVDANVFTVQYKKLYSYEIHYVDENDDILESVINQTSSNQVEVPLKKFDGKELLLLEGETADTEARIFNINKELETNVFEIHYQSIVQSENVEPLSEE